MLPGIAEYISALVALYWVPMKDRRHRIKTRIARGQIVSPENHAWLSKAGKLGRRLGFAFMLLQASIFMTWRIFATDKSILFWVGIVWGWGCLGVWAPIAIYTAEMFRGCVLWQFVPLSLRETTGSFQAAFLLILVIMPIQTPIVWFYSP